MDVISRLGLPGRGLPLLLFLLLLLLGPTSGPAAALYRVATFNLENYLAAPVGTRPAKTALAKAKIRQSLHALNADVLALQEIGGPQALMELRASLTAEGMDYPHWEHVTGADTNIQVAILSRFPIISRHPHTNDSFLLFGRRCRVSRGFAEVDLQIAPRYTLTLITAHLKSKLPVAYADEAELREEEARILRRKINARLEANPAANLIVLGDLNDTKDSRPIRALIGRGRAALIDTRPAERNGDDQPSADPRYSPRRVTWTHYYGKEDSYARFDYILISRGLAREWQSENTFVLNLPNWGLASDHRPLLATFSAEDR